MNTLAITFSPKSILLVMAYLCGSAVFVFIAMSAQNERMKMDAKICQEVCAKW